MRAFPLVGTLSRLLVTLAVLGFWSVVIAQEKAWGELQQRDETLLPHYTLADDELKSMIGSHSSSLICKKYLDGFCHRPNVECGILGAGCTNPGMAPCKKNTEIIHEEVYYRPFECGTVDDPQLPPPPPCTSAETNHVQCYIWKLCECRFDPGFNKCILTEAIVESKCFFIDPGVECDHTACAP